MTAPPPATLVPASIAQRLLYRQRQREYANSDPFVEVFTFTSGFPWTAADLHEAFVRWVLETVTLRAVFIETADGLSVDFPPVDETRLVRRASVTHLPGLDRTREADALVDAFVRAPMDLVLGPLAEMLIVETGAGELRCAVRASRLLFDLTMLAEVREQYLRICYDVAAGRPRRPVDLDRAALAAEVAREAQQHAQGLAQAAAFWNGYLPEERVPLTLPTRIVSGSLRYHERQGDWSAIRVEPATLAAAEALGEKHGATLGDVLEAVFVALLARYSDAEKIVVREISRGGEGEACMSMTARGEAVALVFDVTPQTPFGDLLAQVLRNRARVAEGAQGLAFDAVIPPPDSSRDQVQLLTQAGFRFTRYVAPDGQARPQIQNLSLHRRFRPPTDLMLSVDAFSDETLVSISYCLDLFDPRVIDDLCAHYASLLRGFVHGEHQAIFMPRMLSDEEEHRITHDWNQTASPYPSERSLADLIQRTSEMHPDRVAVVDRHTSLTYRALMARADALSDRLAAHGVRRGDHVVLLQERSVDVVTAIVACVRMGVAYVPLEPDYPSARIEALCAQCSAVAMVCDASLAPLAPEGLPCITDLDPPVDLSLKIRRASSQPTDIAYVLFTSGSTGVPKAAQITQRGVVNLVTWLIDTFAFDERDRVMLKTPYSHDISVPEIFIPLLTGGCVVVADPGGHRDPTYLRELTRREQVSVLHFVPTMLAEFVRGLGVTDLPSLRYVFAGGEALVSDLAQSIRTTYPWRLINVYGPTECTDYATWWPMADDAAAICPIGRPIGNTRCYVLGPSNDLKPVGVAGELCISGDGVGMGYLGNPEKTAATFVQNPFEPGRVMYRSGDICRWRPDGTLEFIRRDDGQVKVRGHRVELGEIESRLTDHPQVAQAVVTVRTDRSDVRQLVAYVQLDGACAPAALRAWCKDTLAEYMVPSVFVIVKEFARTLSGKVDRKLLPAPVEEEAEVAIAPPRTPTQAQVLQLVLQTLGRTQLSVDTPLVEAGLDSIHAIRVCGRLRAMGFDVPVSALFEQPTIEAFADWLDARGAATHPAPAVELTAPLAPAPLWAEAAARPPEASASRAPLTDVQQAMIVTSELHPGAGTYIEQILFLVDDAQAADVVTRMHDCLASQPLMGVTVVEDAGDYFFVDADRGAPAPAFIDGSDAVALAAFLAADRARGFALSDGPLWRLGVVGIGGGRRCIVWTHHHVLLDGQSMLALQAEMLRAAAGEPVRSLGGGVADLARFAEAVRAWTEAHAHEAEAFWARCLEGAEPTEALPVRAVSSAGRRIEPDAASGGGLTLAQVYHLAAADGVSVDRVTLTLDKAPIARLCARARVTPSTVLRSAWGRLYAHYLNRDDVLIGVTSSGRSLPMPGMEAFLGCSLVTFPVRMKLDPTQSVTSWLQASHAAGLSAMEWEHYPYARIADLVTGGSAARLLHHIFVYEDDYGLARAPRAVATPFGSIDQTDYPLIIQVDAASDAIQVHFSFDPACYDRAQIASVASRYRIVLEQIVRSPDDRLGAIELVDATEKRQLLAAQPVRLDIGEATVEQRIARVMATRGDAIALRFESSTWTYRDLDAAVEAIRAQMADAGVREGAAVALQMPRGPFVIASILAAWRLGAYYVPLDPALPVAVVSQMLADSQPAAVVTFGVSDTGALSQPGGPPCITLGSPDAVLAQGRVLQATTSRSGDPLPNARASFRAGASLDDVAYVLYTSGSTGTPKGVMQTQRTLLNMWVWMEEAMQVGPTDAIIYKTPYTFDVSLPDMFYLLTAGGTVVIARDGLHADPDYLADLLTASGATIIQFVPSMLDVFISSGGFERAPALRWVMAAGERLTRAQVQAFLQVKAEHGLRAELRNLYGPTETFYITDHLISEEDARVDTDPPIGTVFPNNAAYVIDKLGALCGIGVGGELIVAGNQVARGYHHREALTAARFGRDPFATTGGRDAAEGVRTYRTGDTCFWDGRWRLHYQGRSDDQVKVNGVRIELGAVVAAITQIRGVHRAAVTTSDEKPPALLAFVQTDDVTLDAERVRAECGRRLPPAAVPSRVLVVEDFPMTRHGKVDLAALRQRSREVAAASAVGAHRGARGPATELERVVADLLAQVRPEIPALSVDASIFDSGYSSLDAVRLAVGLRRAGHPLEVAECYALGTIEAIAARLVGGPPPAGTRAPGATGAAVSHGGDWSRVVRRALDAFASGAPVPMGVPDPTWPPPDAGAVVITGASGFLGRHVAAYLLRRGRRVLLLGRDLAARVAEALRKADPTLDVSSLVVDGRLRLTACDLSTSGLGLSPEQARWLATSSGPFIHAAALVHHLFPYERLERENVTATGELLALLRGRAAGRFVFVSTVATILGQQIDAEGYAVSEAPPPLGGYVESKWVAEQVVRAAHGRGQDATIVRPPRLYASHLTGAFNERDALARLLQGCMQAGAVPDRIGSEPLLSVDDAVETLWQRAIEPGSPPAAQLPWVDVDLRTLFEVIRAHGIVLAEMPVEAWREAIMADEMNPAVPVLSDFGLGPGETEIPVDYRSVAPPLDGATAERYRSHVIEATKRFVQQLRPS